jgi:DnaJ like chaperone protein
MVDDTVTSEQERARPRAAGGFLSRLVRKMRVWRYRRRESAAQSIAFTGAFVALAAKMAAADGVALKSEFEAFERFMEAGPTEASNIRMVYDLAKRDVTGFETYADRIGKLLERDPTTKRRVVECLMYVACADGILHPAEDRFLQVVAQRFGYTDQEFRAIRALFVHDPDSPYAILEIEPSASLRDVKQRYKKLVQINHPDRLIAEDAPTAVIKAATVKLAAINAAYDAILKERSGADGS